jgi:nitrite reductase/ring-hydroxylating ferredoxin subunit
MPEEVKEAYSGSCEECSRRRFTAIGLGAVAIAGAGSAVFGYAFLSPNALYEPSPIVDAGKPDRYPLDSVTPDAASGLYIVHRPEGIYTLSAVCTHLGCLTAWKPELGIIACPCHGSKFRTDGTKIEGPAPRPLPWLRTWVSDDGDLLIDRSEPLAQRQFVRI